MLVITEVTCDSETACDRNVFSAGNVRCMHVVLWLSSHCILCISLNYVLENICYVQVHSQDRYIGECQINAKFCCWSILISSIYITHSTANDKALGQLSTSYMPLMHTAHARFGNRIQ